MQKVLLLIVIFLTNWFLGEFKFCQFINLTNSYILFWLRLKFTDLIGKRL